MSRPSISGDEKNWDTAGLLDSFVKAKRRREQERNIPRHPPNQLLYRVVENTAWLVVSRMYQTVTG